MRRKPPIPSALEVVFTPTPDGLVVDRVILRPANADAERDLRAFLGRFRDPDLDLDARAICEPQGW